MRAPHAPSRQTAFESLGTRFLWCVPAIFVLGVVALALSWALFYVYHPDGFVGTLPTISETISRTPSSFAFQFLMAIVTPSIAVCWLLNFHVTRAHLATLTAAGRDMRLAGHLNLISCVLGIAAGVFLAGLSAFRLHDGHLSHMWHIWLSESFYGTQVLAFIVDSWCASLRRSPRADSTQAKSLRARLGIAVSTSAGAVVFLYLYLARDSFADAYLAQAVYVSCEYVLATVCFAYPMAAYPELRAYYGSVRETALA